MNCVDDTKREKIVWMRNSKTVGDISIRKCSKINRPKFENVANLDGVYDYQPITPFWSMLELEIDKIHYCL